MPHPKPFLTHPDRSVLNSPLRVWVSVNVHKTVEPDAYAAKAAVTRMIEEGGGLVVEKRASADLLVVDRSTQFYQTVLHEHQKYGRDWQRFVERDWVENCVRKGKMAWPRRDEPAEGEVDSMAEDDPVPAKGHGPGRPPGK